MFYLGGSEFPRDREALRKGLTEGIGAALALPELGKVVTLEGEAFPQLEKLRIDLSGAAVEPQRKPPKPEGVQRVESGIETGRLEVAAHPLKAKGAPVELDLMASAARFDFGKDTQARAWLVLTAATDGRIAAEVRRADLEAVILAVARSQAAKQGVEVQETKLVLTQQGPRSVGAEVRVKVRKGFFGATVRVRGRLDVDDQLTARISGLRCDGEGIIGGLACGAIEPRLRQFDGKEIPLMAFSTGEVRLRDLKIAVNGSIKVTAAFGS